MAANIRCIMRAKANYGAGLSKLKVNLTPTQSGAPWQDDTVNNAPYVFRQIPMGNREWNKLVGGTVAWNQLVQNGNFASSSGWSARQSSISIANNVATVVPTSAGTERGLQMNGTSVADAVVGHKYFLAVDFRTNEATNLKLGFMGASAVTVVVPSVNTWGRCSAIWVTNNSTPKLNLTAYTVGSVGTSAVLEYRNAFAVDLTQMFGSTIADYVYSLEHATAGSGIAWLKSYGYFTEDYYAYTAPTLRSVEATSHVTKDANDSVIATYPLDSDLVLRGIPKLSNGNLYYDGDTYEWDGTVTRKYGEVDLGTLTWSRAAVSDHYVFWATVTDKALNFNFILAPYVNAQTVRDSLADKQAGTYNNTNGMNRITIRDDSYTDATAFKTAMSGVYLVYELATQTTESADPYTNPQVCDPDGTEEWTDHGVSQGTRDYAVPVGHESTYAMAYPIEGVDSFVVTADDGTTHTYPVSIDVPVYKATVDVLAGEVTNYMDEIASYNGETIGEPWLSSLDVYSPGATPTTGAQVVYTRSDPEEGPATVTGDPSELSGVVSVTSTEGTVEWSELSEIGIKCIMKRKNPFQ